MFRAVLHQTASSLMSDRAPQSLVSCGLPASQQRSIQEAPRTPTPHVPRTTEALPLHESDGPLPPVCFRPVCCGLELLSAARGARE